MAAAPAQRQMTTVAISASSLAESRVILTRREIHWEYPYRQADEFVMKWSRGRDRARYKQRYGWYTAVRGRDPRR